MSIFRQRFFWTGLGGGVIIGALLLQLMTVADRLEESGTSSGPPVQAEVQSWSEEMWRTYAEQAGYAVYPADSQMYSEEEVQAEIAAALAAFEVEMADLQHEAVDQAAADTDQAPPDEPGVNTGSAEAEPAVIQVTIPSGVLASEVADLLYDLGIIESRETFEQRMKDRRLTPRIRVGTYSIRQGEDMDAIIDQITQSAL